MKKLILLACLASALDSSAQSDQSLTFGWGWGFHGNSSEFAGGMEEASGKFHHNEYSGVALNFISRYDLNQRFAFTSGLGIYSWGFDFSLREKHNLRTGFSNSSYVKTSLQAIEVPFMAHLKSNLDCTKGRWIVGVGFSAAFITDRNVSKFVDPNNEGFNNTDYLRSEASTSPGPITYFRFSAGRERLTKRGGILHAAFIVNLGFKDVANAKVTYSAEGQDFDHEFKNRGNFVGFRLAFFCGRCSTRLVKPAAVQQ